MRFSRIEEIYGWKVFDDVMREVGRLEPERTQDRRREIDRGDGALDDASLDHEVVGVVGEAPERILVVSTPEEAERILEDLSLLASSLCIPPDVAPTTHPDDVAGHPRQPARPRMHF